MAPRYRVGDRVLYHPIVRPSLCLHSAPNHPTLTASLRAQGGGGDTTSTSIGVIEKIMTETGPAGSITVQASEEEPRYDILNEERSSSRSCMR